VKTNPQSVLKPLDKSPSQQRRKRIGAMVMRTSDRTFDTPLLASHPGTRDNEGTNGGAADANGGEK
jgi:hypothetical protein